MSNFPYRLQAITIGFHTNTEDEPTPPRRRINHTFIFLLIELPNFQGKEKLL
jgi:hypothetical protein